jgi:hypothetical protein
VIVSHGYKSIFLKKTAGTIVELALTPDERDGLAANREEIDAQLA